MSKPMNELETLLDRAVDQIAASEPDADTARLAADRVWTRLQADSAQTAAKAAEVDEIRGCDDYQTLIPAYLDGVLPEARKLLLEDHTRECIPCRRALKAAREGEVAAVPAPAVSESSGTGSIRSYWKWAAAAALVVGVGLTQYLVRELLPPAGPSAVIQSVDGQLFRVASTSQLPLEVGDEIAEGELIRTGRGGSAIVKLRDGSLAEIRRRSELKIEENRRGATLELGRGSVIVQAAPQGRGHLYVRTEDCLVAVTGTIFSVNHGTKGSRISVVEGQVHVHHDGEEMVLDPGDQVATRTNLAAVPVEDEVSWSRDAGRYLELLREYTELRQQIRQDVPRPELRYTSRLLDLMPERTVFFAALPNLGETISETHRVIRDNLDRNSMLAEWWNAQGAQQFGPKIDEVIEKLGEVGEFLGQELAVGGQATGDDFSGPLVLAEVVDSAGLRAFLEEQIAEIVAHEELPEDARDHIVFVEDPFSPPAGSEDVLFIWLHEDLLVATPEPVQIAGVAAIALAGAANPFVDSDFHGTIAELYRDGAEFLVAVDFEQAMTTQLADGDSGAEERDTIQRLGFLDARHLVLEQQQGDERTHHKASLTFSEARRGLASWLAEPAPMGALDFISSDAQLVASFVFEDPVKLLDDIYDLAGSDKDFSDLEDFESRHGLSLRDDVAASLGGEFAFALDGPLFPEPSWKLVVEVYDPARLQWTIEEALAELNNALANEGKESLVLAKEEVGGRTFYSLTTDIADVHYTYVEGYLVAGPNRAVLDRAMRFHESGYTITDAAAFTALLPPGGRNNFSGLIYQDLGEVMQGLAERVAQGQLSEEQRQQLEAMKAGSGPGLGCIYGEEKRITVAASTEGDLLDAALLNLLGVKNPAGIEQALKALTDGAI